MDALFSTAGRFETNRGEVCWGFGTTNYRAYTPRRPLARRSRPHMFPRAKKRSSRKANNKEGLLARYTFSNEFSILPKSRVGIIFDKLVGIWNTDFLQQIASISQRLRTKAKSKRQGKFALPRCTQLLHACSVISSRYFKNTLKSTQEARAYPS